MYLERYHGIEINCCGVWRILKRLKMNRLPYNQRFKRYEKPLPRYYLQVDVKFLEREVSSSQERYYQYTAIDYCTIIRIMKIYDRLNQKNSIDFIDYAMVEW
ncbi:MAG: hypothetical protein N3D17_06915 [bacterium]|nr:hypothetical protein [bacterium]